MLDGAVAIVTGAGRGLGRAEALELASHGARVVVNDLGVTVDGTPGAEHPAQQVVEEIKASGGEAVAHDGDVADFDQARDLIRLAVDTYGDLNILVNNAGILRDRMVFNMSPEEWDAVLKVHLRGHFCTSRWAAAYWRDRSKDTDGPAYGRVINTSSEAFLFGAPGQPNYAAAKMGIVGLTYSCANALGRYGVTVNAISPGAATRMTDSVPTERRTARAGADEWSPDNVAPVVAYLASERSGWITGRVVHSSGYEVALYSNPEPVVRVIGSGPWDVDDLAAQVERSFGPLLGRTR